MTGPQMRLITSDALLPRLSPTKPHARSSASMQTPSHSFFATGDTKPLKPFEGVVIADRQLLTDPDALEAWAIR